jgi:hypothetical protein
MSDFESKRRSMRRASSSTSCCQLLVKEGLCPGEWDRPPPRCPHPRRMSYRDGSEEHHWINLSHLRLCSFARGRDVERVVAAEVRSASWQQCQSLGLKVDITSTHVTVKLTMTA